MESPNHPLPIAFPWHEVTWSRLTSAIERLPHGILIHGIPGVGKTGFAMRLAHYLICDNPSDQSACGKCKGCRLLAAGNHPDLAMVQPEEPGKAIVVDQIRALAEFLYLRPHSARHKITVITPAEAMNINASNSLLKLLEEPPLGNFVVLVSHNASKLTATIRSRCTALAFKAPATAQALAWLDRGTQGNQAELLLKLANGAPVTALKLAQSEFLQERDRLFKDIDDLTSSSQGLSNCASRWKKIGASHCLDWFQDLTGDLIKLITSASTAERLKNADRGVQLQAWVNRLNLKKLYQFLDTLTEARRVFTGPLDEQLLLEDILIRWHRMTYNG